MKKLVVAAVAVFVFGVTNAQEVKFGAKVGLNLSNFTGDVQENKMKIGFQVGAFAEISISDKFAVQPEVLYSTLGAKFTEEGVDISMNLDYIVVPVMAKFYVAEGFSLEAGPQIGFLLAAKVKTDDFSLDSKEFFNSTDFGVNVGAGYNVTDNINLGLRYTIGISNIAKDSGDDTLGNSNFAFAVGYKF